LKFFSPHGQGNNGIASEPNGITNETTNGTTKELLHQKE
jgi:hypothetical protein